MLRYERYELCLSQVMAKAGFARFRLRDSTEASARRASLERGSEYHFGMPGWL